MPGAQPRGKGLRPGRIVARVAHLLVVLLIAKDVADDGGLARQLIHLGGVHAGASQHLVHTRLLGGQVGITLRARGAQQQGLSSHALCVHASMGDG